MPTVSQPGKSVGNAQATGAGIALPASPDAAEAVGAAVAPGAGGKIFVGTASTVQILTMLRDTLIAYVSPQTGAKITDVLGVSQTRLYQVRAPDAPQGSLPTFPYATMRLATRNSGRYHGLRREGTLEIQVHGRPWSQQEDVLNCADVFDQAMLGLVLTKQGITFSHAFQRDDLPMAGDPADSEVVTVRLTYSLVIWPQFLTSPT